MHLFASLSAAAVITSLAVTPSGGLPAYVSPASYAVEDSTVTWSVAPASSTAPDGRSRIDIDVDPGESVTEYLAVRNFSDTATRFALSAADGYLTETGRFNMLPSNTPSVASGTWIDVVDSVDVGAGETVVVPFTIHVPDDATPGDHAAGIAASIFSAGSDETGANLGVESRMGFRVLTRVSGDIAPAIGIAAVDATYRFSWNPFAPGTIDLSYEIDNTGNTGLDVLPTVASGVGSSPTDTDSIELLPGSGHSMTGSIVDVWPLGPVTVDVSVDAGARGTTGTATARESIVIWALPLPQLVVLIGLLLVASAALGIRRRRAATISALVEDARREGALAAREEADARAAATTIGSSTR